VPICSAVRAKSNSAPRMISASRRTGGRFPRRVIAPLFRVAEFHAKARVSLGLRAVCSDPINGASVNHRRRAGNQVVATISRARALPPAEEKHTSAHRLARVPRRARGRGLHTADSSAAGFPLAGQRCAKIKILGANFGEPAAPAVTRCSEVGSSIDVGGRGQ